ncbi:MAG: PAS domain S-box protein [Azospirillaceae bacterium]|nr:PAS domain S-box protein [Azospirillaceae bacterium]
MDVKYLSLVRAIIDQSHDPIVAIDSDYNFIAFSESFSEGFEKFSGCQIRIGDNLKEIPVEAPQAMRLFMRHWSRALRGDTFTVEEMTPDSGLGDRVVEFSFSPITDGDDVVCGASMIMHDVTERAHAEDETRQLNRQLEHVVAERNARLLENKVLFRNTFDLAAVGIGLVGLDGQWQRVNKALRTILDYAEDELLALTIRDVTHADDRSPDLLADPALRSGAIERRSRDLRFVRRNGEAITVAVTVAVDRISDAGLAHHFIVVVKDIDEQQRAQEKLRRAEQDYRCIFDTAGVGICQIDMATGLFLRVNQKMSRIVGYSEAELLTRGIADLLVDTSRDDGVPMWADRCPAGEERGLELRLVHKDGHLVWVSMTVTVGEDDLGEPCRAAVVVRDISRLKHLEHDLHRVLDSLPVAILIAHDAADRRLSVNRAYARMVRLADGEGRQIPGDTDLLPGNVRLFEAGVERPADQAMFRRAARGEDVRHCQQQLVFGDGSSIWVYGDVVPICDPDGSVHGTIAAFCDVTPLHPEVEPDERPRDVAAT